MSKLRLVRGLRDDRLLAYGIIVFATVAGAVLALATHLRMDPVLAVPPLWTLILWGASFAARRLWPRVATAMETTALLYGQALAFLFAIYGVIPLSGPFADQLLASWDNALGFNYRVFVSLALPHLNWFQFFYQSFNWQGVLIIWLLVSAGREERAWRLISSVGLALLVTTAIFPFFPADGAMVHYGFSPVKGIAAWRFGPVLHTIKGGEHHITLALMAGVISFPSFHAALGYQFAWAAWPTKLRWPLVLVNVGMSVSAVIIGGHYLVDIIAGIVIGAAALRRPAMRTQLSSESEYRPLASLAPK